MIGDTAEERAPAWLGCDLLHLRPCIAQKSLDALPRPLTIGRTRRCNHALKEWQAEIGRRKRHEGLLVVRT